MGSSSFKVSTTPCTNQGLCRLLDELLLLVATTSIIELIAQVVDNQELKEDERPFG